MELKLQGRLLYVAAHSDDTAGNAVGRFANRLTGISGEGGEAEYTYNADGMRSTKRVKNMSGVWA